MLIKRLHGLFFFLCICCLADAQISLVLQVPPVGVMQKNQLWNMALISSSSGLNTVSIQLTLVDAVSGQPVMTATTRALSMSKGTNAITAKDVAPVQYDYLSPLFTDRDPNGFLPVGNFKACYTVILPVDHGMPAAEDCVPLEVQPLSPPQLNSPPDTSVVETAFPQFSWLPPTPVNLFSALNYQMILVEVGPDQGSYQAIQENIPVYNISHLLDPVNPYPTSAKPLDTGKLYAWRVLVLNQDQYIDQSEVWTFKLATPKAAPVVVPGGNYISLRSARDRSAGVQLLPSDTIGIRYYCFEKDHQDTLSFSSADGKLVKQVSQWIVYGENYLTYILNSSFQKGKIYRVQVADNRKNIYSASFILK